MRRKRKEKKRIYDPLFRAVTRARVRVIKKKAEKTERVVVCAHLRSGLSSSPRPSPVAPSPLDPDTPTPRHPNTPTHSRTNFRHASSQQLTIAVANREETRGASAAAPSLLPAPHSPLCLLFARGPLICIGKTRDVARTPHAS
jgi:hypothetical protein